jgi:flavorubredoxin
VNVGIGELAALVVRRWLESCGQHHQAQPLKTEVLMTRVDEVAKGIFRISAFDPTYRISFNQFLIVGEKPTLIHTGVHPAYDSVRKAVAQVLDPKTLAYIVVPHFEADECGGMGRFLKEAPQAVLLCSEVGSGVNLSGWDCSGPVQGMREGDRVHLGEHTLQFIETPHVHHWDSMMVFEQTTQSLFPADLFIQPGDQPPIVRENLGKEMCHLYREVGIFASEKPVLQAVERIERLNSEWIHPMHGGSLPKSVAGSFFNALRSEPFAYEGKVLGRTLPT